MDVEQRGTLDDSLRLKALIVLFIFDCKKVDIEKTLMVSMTERSFRKPVVAALISSPFYPESSACLSRFFFAVLF